MDNIEIENVTNEIDIINTINDISIENVENDIEIIQEENNIEISTPENTLELVFNERGANATVNGYSTVEIIAGDNITIEQDEEQLTISATGEPQVQSDYEQTDNTKVDYIKNKPTIPSKVSDLEIDIDTDDIPETTTNLYVPTLPTDNPTSLYLNGSREWKATSIGGGGYNANLYFTSINSDISGYKKIEYTVEDTEIELTIPTTTTEILARSYLFDYGLATTTIDAGLWVVNYRAKVNNSKGATIRFEAFLRHTDNTETTLFTASSDLITNSIYATLRNESNQPAFTCVATDRLGVRIYASTTHPAGITLNTIIGDGHGSYFYIPLKIRHNQLRDLNGDSDYQHITTTEKGLVNNSVQSVNNITAIEGNVTLTADDVNALPDDTVIFSGDYDDLSNKPTIPSNHSDLGRLNEDSDYQHITTTEKAKALTDYFKLDQTIPQEIINGIPLLEATRVINADNQLADKKYVDDNDIAKITTLNKIGSYDNYAILDNGYKYTFNRDASNVITSVTKEEI